MSSALGAVIIVWSGISRSAKRLNSNVSRHPLAASVLFGTTSKWCIDLIVQHSEQQVCMRGEDRLAHSDAQAADRVVLTHSDAQAADRAVWSYNARRGAAFAFFGVVYLGVVQQQIYYRWFPWLLSKMALRSPTGKALVQVALDQVGVFPLIYFPLFYAIQGAVHSENGNPVDGLLTGLQRCKVNLREDCVAAWSVWAPVQLVNFALVPRHWRAPFVSGTGLIWTAYLSMKRGTAVADVA